MASKSAQHEPEKAEVIEELLDHCDTTLDRVKVLYEQFFLGIQKQPPTHLHTDVERKLRELQQLQIRNTALRYRFATVQQKFGSYNNYWRRTLRQIENGTYHRNLAKIGRQAAQTGEDIPDEILAAMPKRMREQVKRDREAALAMKRRREGTSEEADFLEEQDTNVGTKKTRTGAHVLEDDGEFDLDAYFAAVTNEDAPDQTTPDMPVFAPPRTPARAAPPASVNDDPPTDVPAQIVSRPAPITNSPIQHASPAVRAAVGMRTPPAGLPRVSPGYQQTQPLPNMSRASGGFPAIHTQPGHASGQHPATGHASGQHPATGQSRQPGTVPPPPGPVPSPPPSGLPPVPPPPGHRPGLAPSQVSRPLSVMPGASNARGPVAVESMSGPFPREQPAGATMSGIRGAAPATTRMPTAPDATRPGMPATTRMPTAPDAPRPNMPATTRMPTAPDATRPGMAATTRMPTAPDAMRPNVPATTRMPTAPDAMRPNVPATTRMPTAPDAPRPGMPASTMRLPTSPGATASTRAATAPDAPRSGMPAATREPMAPDAPRPNMPATTRRAAPDAMRPNVPATTRMPAAPDATTPGMPAAPARPSSPHPGARTAPGMGPRPGAPPAPPRPPPPPGAERPFKPRIQTEPGVKPAPARVGPPPGMTDADVNALYSKYVKAKEAVGEKTGPGSYGKLLQTINAQAPKIMEQYKAKGVDFQVVVKDNQVVIRAKPKP